MHSVGSRSRLLAGGALGFGLAMIAAQPAKADSVCGLVAGSLPPITIAADCTDLNGNGRAESGGATALAAATPTANAVVQFSGDMTLGQATGYIESTTAGRGVLWFTSTAPLFTYTGTGSTLVGQAGATGATILSITAPSVTLFSGTLTALGAGSTALGVTANGGAGSGAINATIDGDILSAGGPAIDLNSTNAGATGDILLTSIAGNTITSGNGDAVNISSAGSGAISVNLGDAVNATGGFGVLIADSPNGGDISVTTDAVTADLNAINVSSQSTTADVTIVANGPLTATGVFGALTATLLTGTGDISITTNDAVSGGAGIQAAHFGTGSVTVDAVGPVSATLGNGIQAQAAGGAIAVTTGDVTSTGGIGILASQFDPTGSGDISVTTSGDVSGTVGIDATNDGTGGITITTGDGLVSGTTSSAIIAENTNAASADSILLTIGAGGASGAGPDDAVIVATAGTGAITVNSSGPVTGGEDGIDTSATTGATTINITGGSVTGVTDGVDARATTGTIAVTLSGGADVTGPSQGIVVGSDGAKTIAIGAGSVVTGDEAILSLGTGATQITNSGTLTGITAAIESTAAATTVSNLAGGTINGAILLSPVNDTLTNAGTINATGALDFGAGTDTLTNSSGGVLTVAAATPITGLETLTNAGTITAASGLLFDAGNTAVTNTGTFNVAGTLDFGGGSDSFANNAAGTFTLTGATTLANLETFTNAGRINLNTFVLTGPAIAFTNTGTIDTSGSAGLAGFTTFNNAGILDLAAGTFTVPAAVFTNTGTILADEGATTITGQTSFANSGTIDLQDGATGDVLTINSAFVGSGGSNLDIDFTGTASDRLVIVGAASGSTAVDAAYLGGGLNLDGVLVVDTTSSSANAFVLGAVTGETPLVDVSLVQVGADYFLVAAPTAAAFNPLVVPGFATDLWYQSADEIFAETVKPATTTGISFWGEGYYSRDKYGDDDDSVVIDGVEFDVDNERKTKRYGAQMGVDYGFGGGRVGLTGGYAWADANGNADADLNAKGWNIGVYGQFGGLTGFHGEFLAKHDRYDAEFDNGAFDGEEFDIRSTGFDGSVGYRFGMGGAATFDIHGGLSHVRTKVDDISAFGFDYDIEKLTSTRGRLGARAIFGGSLSPYIDGTVYREFNGAGEVELFDGAVIHDLDTDGQGTWVRLEGGLSGNDGPGPILAAWGDFGDRKGFGLRAGWRLGGAAVVEAPPPPPPPPYVAPPAPPPPATQTCPDGSVILATDMCPPPPPPPPPPEPERG